MCCCWDYYQVFTDLIKIAVPIIAGTWALYLFRENNRLKRAKWLKSLFKKFYESENYKECRKILDSGDRVNISQIEGIELEEKFTDYLNFFEFILTLMKLKQIERNEVEMLFDYYLRNIRNIDGIMEYLNKHGFENLHGNLDSFSKK
jgi:hypothetical protein